jgi:hypothetical protein
MIKIEKEFVPYEESLKLKELGFDEECMALFTNGKLTIYGKQSLDSIKGSGLHNRHLGNSEKMITAPLYQQAFRWFREKCNLRSFVDTRVYDVDSPNQWIYDFQIKMGDGVDTQPFYSGDFDTYEEAELACLKKLIGIVINK